MAAGLVGLDHADRGPDAAGIDEASLNVQDRGLGKAAEDLVGADDRAIGAAAHRRWRQVRVEMEVWCPRLIDEERHAVPVRDRRNRRQV